MADIKTSRCGYIMRIPPSGLEKCLSRDWLGSLKIEFVRSLERELYF